MRKGRRKSDGLVVAIKCIQRHKLKHSEVENLKREVEIMREIVHPHVIGLLDVFDEELKEIYLVTEFVAVNLVIDCLLNIYNYVVFLLFANLKRK